MVKGELYLVMDLCSPGSLLDYLKHRRVTFISEVLSDADAALSRQQPSVTVDGYLAPNCLVDDPAANDEPATVYRVRCAFVQMVKGELYLVMDLCSPGSLLDYLKHRRVTFISEVLSDADAALSRQQPSVTVDGYLAPNCLVDDPAANDEPATVYRVRCAFVQMVKGELYLVMDLCSPGSLLDYLKHRRVTFISEVLSDADAAISRQQPSVTVDEYLAPNCLVDDPAANDEPATVYRVRCAFVQMVKGELYLVMDLCSPGSLLDYLKHRRVTFISEVLSDADAALSRQQPSVTVDGYLAPNCLVDDPAANDEPATVYRVRCAFVQMVKGELYLVMDLCSPGSLLDYLKHRRVTFISEVLSDADAALSRQQPSVTVDGYLAPNCLVDDPAANDEPATVYRVRCAFVQMVKGELYLVMDLCSPGSLLDYLKHRRVTFISEVLSDADAALSRQQPSVTVDGYLAPNCLVDDPAANDEPATVYRVRCAFVQMVKGELYLVMDLCSPGSLLDYLKHRRVTFISEVLSDADAALSRQQPSVTVDGYLAPNCLVDDPAANDEPATVYRVRCAFVQMVKGELYLVMDLCSPGSLLDYLKHRRVTFISEVLSDADAALSRQQPSVTVDGYLAPNCLVDDPAANDEPATVYRGELDDNWCNELNENRCKGSVLSTSDLFSFAHQAANGMDYLASKNLIHRDLATRNILLTDERIIKIADFGLARQDHQIYHIEHSKSVPLPIKWMALESILDQDFSVKSDCWSFGVVLWEMFALGETPYPTLPLDPSFVSFLRGGHRLEQPDHCPHEMYPVLCLSLSSPVHDQDLSVNSDCWSFGVVLWEMFVLGETPYPTLPLDPSFVSFLRGGHRLEQPDHCPHEMYPVLCLSLSSSVHDRELSDNSDYWSFGVVLWEMFALGETPYPTLPTLDPSFVSFLRSGHRLEQPDHCPHEMYQLMRQCWLVEPDDRPTFVEARNVIGEQLRRCSKPLYNWLTQLEEEGPDDASSATEETPALINAGTYVNWRRSCVRSTDSAEVTQTQAADYLNVVDAQPVHNQTYMMAGVTGRTTNV